jgi:branched-subunit amino acid transport protein AzlD
MSAGIERVLHAQVIGVFVAFCQDQQSSMQVVGGIVALITIGSVVQSLLYCILC